MEASMKANTPGFEVTPELVAQAEHEKERLDHEIADLQRKLGLVVNFLRLAAAYREAEQPAVAEKSEQPEPVETAAEDIDPSNMMGLIAQIANASTKPLTKKELKAKLVERGIATNRLGSYFYVAVDRLKDRERICVLDDGRVWRAPPKN
jgi:hypothetical protein